MRIKGFELLRAALPLVAPFRTSFGRQTERDVLLVRADAQSSEGWGECVALSQPLYSSEYVDGAQNVIVEHLLPRIAAAGEIAAENVAEVLRPIRGHSMAKAAVEMAVLDAQLKEANVSFSSYLGGVREAVDSGVSIGIMDTIEELLDAVGGYLSEGYRRIKLKIEPGWDLEPVKAVREKFGDILLQVDANTAYALGDAALLARLDDFNLLLIEQPLPEEDVLGHAKLAKHVKTPICLDESITSAKAAADAIELGACAIVNIKAGRVGGYLEAKRIHDVCEAHGVPVWCGGMLETGIGRAANVALASLPNFTLPGDTSASDRYYLQDITEPFKLVDGRLRVPTKPGIGVQIDLDALKSVTVSQHFIKH